MFDAGGLNELADHLLDTATAVERARVVLLTDLAEALGSGVWSASGCLSPTAWLRSRARLSPAEAGRLVRAAELVRRYPGLAEALEAAIISCGHLEVLAGVAQRERLPVLDDHIDSLIVHASQLRTDQFQIMVRHWANLADDTLDHDPAADRFDSRFLQISTTLFGDSDITGRLDTEVTTNLLAALDVHDTGPDNPDNPEPPRNLRQRRADALGDLVAASLGRLAGDPEANDTDDSRRGRRNRLVGTLILDLERILAANPDLDRLHQHVIGLGPIASSTARRLLCDSSIRALTVDADGNPLDLGRSTPTVSPGQRLALTARDHHCQFPGCDRSADWCDAHHIIHWADDGDTDLDNLVLLCRRHHGLVHYGWEIERSTWGDVSVTRPDGAVFREVNGRVQRHQSGRDPVLV
ncbi:MAG: DUF222 domain-containing protein [Actinomycetia bacterium]|nr:DUF222 domain-containing protein [Actinomycetes bacterium]